MPRTLVLSLLLAITTVSAFGSRVSTALSKLDRALELRQEFIAQRQHKIDSLCNILGTDNTSASLLMQIADAYAGFNNDSALAYYYKGSELAEGEAKQPFRWKYASLLPLAGLHEMAERAYDAITPDSVPGTLRASYYDAGRQMYSYISSSFGHYPSVADPLKAKSLRCQEELLKVLPPDSDEYKFNLGEYYFLLGRKEKAKVLLEEIIDSQPDNSNLRARAAHHLSSLARERGDADAYTYYLALSATADVLSATRDVLSLQELGAEIYDKGDVTRAHSYLSYALANAVECGAPLRMIDASRSLPIIESAHMSLIRKSRRTINWVLLAVSVMLLVLIGTMLVLRHQMHKMTVLQTRLKAANNAKEVYISQFLQLCSIYMDKLNQFCKIASRKLAAGQSDELYRMTKSGKFIEEQSSEFYEVFDNAFLHIYPDFVAQVNALLRPDAQIELRPGELLNTDLRILAFMRLGIEESARIAQVLNYSLNTIYSYRNRLKAKAVDKDNFERNVMNIGNIS